MTETWIAVNRQRHGPFNDDRAGALLRAGVIPAIARVWVPQYGRWLDAAPMPARCRAGDDPSDHGQTELFAELPFRGASRDVHPPCPHRGNHTRLAECWECWTDVMAGAITIEEALRPEVA